MTEDSEKKMSTVVAGWVCDYPLHEANILALCDDKQPTNAAICYVNGLKCKALIDKLNKEDFASKRKILVEMKEIHESILKSIEDIMSEYQDQIEEESQDDDQRLG